MLGCQRHSESTSWCCIVFIVSEIMITDTRYCRRQTITQVLRTYFIIHFVKCCQFARFTSTKQRFPSRFMSLTSFIPSTVSLWNNLDLNVRNSPNISCFKSRIKEKTVKSPEYYGEGSRKLSILFPKSNVSIFLLVSLMFLKRQYLSFWYNGHSIR
jgi:hypothetical protein